MKNKKTFFLAIVVILAIAGGLIVSRMTSSENLTGKLNLPKNKSVVKSQTVKNKKSNYESVLSKMSPEKKRLVKIQTYNASISTVNRFRSMLDLLEEAVNESSDSQSLRLQVLEQTQEADDKLSQLLSHYNNNFGNSPGDIADPVFEGDLLEIPIFDLISTVIAPSWMSDIDFAGMMDDMQALNSFLMGIGVIGFDFTTDVGAVTMVGGAAVFFGTDGAFLGTGTIGTRPQRGGGSKLGLDTFSCEHKRCGGKGKKYKRDANGKWVDDGFCADCGWRSIVNNTNPDDFAADIFSSGPVNLNDWLSALQNLNAALDNYLGEIPSEPY